MRWLCPQATHALEHCARGLLGGAAGGDDMARIASAKRRSEFNWRWVIQERPLPREIAEKYQPSPDLLPPAALTAQADPTTWGGLRMVAAEQTPLTDHCRHLLPIVPEVVPQAFPQKHGEHFFQYVG